MYRGFNSQCLPGYRVLTEEQVLRLHHATLELLETVGVRVLHPEAVAMLAAAGCGITGGDQVKIPNWLVEEGIRGAPSRITVYNRAGKEAMRLEGRKAHFGMGTDLTRTYDLQTGELRQSRLEDAANAARIADALEELDFIASYALPYDAPTHLMYIDSFKAQLENSSKPIFFTAAGEKDLRVIHAMASAVAGSDDALREKPFLIHYAEPLSPLTHTRGAVAKLLFCADHAVPVNYTPGMMAGATAPVTLAGAIVQGNAEALSGIVMHQLRSKGAPIISGFGMATLDMRTSACVYGCPEYRLALSACADLYHYYGIPMWSTAGASDSHCLDQQAAMEWTASLLTAALDGANLVHDVGYLGQGLVGHPAALVMCAEIISYVKRFIRGFEIDSEHLALDVIRRVGPQGHFLGVRHTANHHRREHWRPELCNRGLLDTWLAEGGRSWGDNAVERAKAILGEHQPVPLDAGVRLAVSELREKAARELAGIEFEA